MSSARLAKSFVILSSCPEPWGGSEELWCDTALSLKQRGHRVHVVRMIVDRSHPRVKALSLAGIPLCSYMSDSARLKDYIASLVPPRFRWYKYNPYYGWLVRWLKQIRPDLVIISQGANFDGIDFAHACRRLGLAYVLISQKASDLDWPFDDVRSEVATSHVEAKKSYFVSHHNRHLTECQIGVRLTNAEVVWNPIMTPVEETLSWPSVESGIFKLACVARLYMIDKGQDILLQVLAQKKWKDRPLTVEFFGKGMNQETLKSLAEFLGLANVKFVGFSTNVLELWRTHHALVLPSRAEGLPLALVEAMYCGRPAILTNVGGNAEVVEDGITGFVADSPSVTQIDDAMERAWQCRDQWEDIGKEASRRIRALVKPGAGDVLASKLLEDIILQNDGEQGIERVGAE